MERKYENFPLQDYNKLMYAYTRYTFIFERADKMLGKIPKTTIPGRSTEIMVPFMIEAPLSSVEILEAILEQTQPFQIHNARHIPRSCTTRTPKGSGRHWVANQRRRYNEYCRFQGRLAEDRVITYVCIPERAIHTIRNKLSGSFCPVKLHYISIPWGFLHDGSDLGLAHPWALVLDRKPYPGSFHTYENRLRQLLESLDLVGCKFERSRLRPTTTPLPECLYDWFAGYPGKTAALPYYECDLKQQDRDEDGGFAVVLNARERLAGVDLGYVRGLNRLPNLDWKVHDSSLNLVIATPA